MSGRIGVALAALLMALATGAAADEAPQVVRLIASAPTADTTPAKAFVLDLRLEKGEGAFQKTVSGWYAALAPDTGSEEVTGTCIRNACAIDVDLSDGKVSLSGDFTGGASAGTFSLAGDEEGKAKAEGAVQFSPLTGEVPGVGVLAAPDAVTGAELKMLIEWTGTTVSSGNAGAPDWPDDIEREALGAWQYSVSEPGTGLVTVADLATLRASAKAAQAKAGWTAITGTGWSAGYPAAVLSQTSTAGAERRFATPDGKAVMTLEVGKGLSDDDFSALVERLTSGGADRSSNNYTRVNGDLDLTYVEGGRSVVVAMHNREGGLVKLTFSRPADEPDAWTLYDVVLPSSLVVTDELKAP